MLPEVKVMNVWQNEELSRVLSSFLLGSPDRNPILERVTQEERLIQHSTHQ